MTQEIFDPTFLAPTQHWHAIDDGRVQCDLCPRFCQLKLGQRGFCFVRANHNHSIVLTSYGRSSGFCIDPIEKKPLNHFLPGSPVLSFGTAGCNLSCKFCQNWDISKSRQTDTLAMQASPLRIAEAAKANGCRSVAFTYNDPVIFHEYAIDVAAACHAEGVKTLAVSAGYVCDKPRAEFYAHIDAANIDLKAFTDKFYRRLTGSHLQPVLDTLLYLRHETQVWFEITTLLIPDQNDSNTELDHMTRWIAENLGTDIPIHFTAFHPDYKMLNVQKTPASSLTRARDIAMNNGLNHVYTGNVHDKRGSSTYCSSCGELLIGRDWYELSDWKLTQDGRCMNCKTPLAGVFEAQAGDWGSKRVPIKI